MQHRKGGRGFWRLTEARNVKPGDCLNDPRTGLALEVAKVKKRAGQIEIEYVPGRPVLGVTVPADRTMRVRRKRRKKGNEGDGSESG